MQPLKSWWRFAALAATAALATPLVGTPAAAAQPNTPGYASLGILIPDKVHIARDLQIPKEVKFTITNWTGTTAHNLVVEIDTSLLPPTFQVTLPGADQGCTVADDIATCTLPKLAVSVRHAYIVKLLPSRTGSEFWGDSGIIPVTVSAANARTEEDKTVVQLGDAGTDLVVNPIADMTLASGSSATIPVALSNVGSTSAERVAVVLNGSSYIEFPNPYSNCQYDQEESSLICVIDQPLAPGEMYKIAPETPLRLKVSERTPGPEDHGVYVNVIPLTEEAAAKVAPKRSTGTELRLTPLRQARSMVNTDLNTWDNLAGITIHVPRNVADSVAVGAKISGDIDQIQDVPVGVRNDGPADTWTHHNEWLPTAKIALPTGLRVLAVDEQCVPVKGNKEDWDHKGKPVGLTYICFPWRIPAGTTHTFVFKVKIVGEPGKAGVIKADGGPQDRNVANNSAPITLTLATNGQGGGQGGLPITGGKTSMVIVGGLLLVIGGVVAFFLARRRRIVTVIVD